MDIDTYSQIQSAKEAADLMPLDVVDAPMNSGALLYCMVVFLGLVGWTIYVSVKEQGQGQ